MDAQLLQSDPKWLEKIETQFSTEATDNEIVHKILIGDENAFTELFERYKRFVGKIAASFFRRPEEVEDIIQISFAQVYFSLRSFRGQHQKSFAKWISQIAHNACLDLLRQKSRSPEKLQSELSQEESVWLQQRIGNQNSGSLEKKIILADFTEKILMRLAPEDQWVLRMQSIEQMSINEIADITNWSKTGVKVRIFRARKRLWKIIKSLESIKNDGYEKK